MGLEGVVTRTIMLVLKTRRAAEVIAATQSMVAKLRWWGFRGDGSRTRAGVDSVEEVGGESWAV